MGSDVRAKGVSDYSMSSRLATEEPGDVTLRDRLAADAPTVKSYLKECRNDPETEVLGSLLEQALGDNVYALKALKTLGKRSLDFKTDLHLELSHGGFQNLKRALTQGLPTSPWKAGPWEAGGAVADRADLLETLVGDKIIDLSEAQYLDVLEAIDKAGIAAGAQGPFRRDVLTDGLQDLREAKELHASLRQIQSDPNRNKHVIGSAHDAAPNANIGGKRPIGRNSVFSLRLNELKAG